MILESQLAAIKTIPSDGIVHGIVCNIHTVSETLNCIL